MSSRGGNASKMDAAEYDQWLQLVTSQYATLSDLQRNNCLDHVIVVSGAAQLYHLSTKLDVLLKRDFMRLLPTEIVFHLLNYFDSQTLLRCCQVSSQWDRVVGSCVEVWKNACTNLGLQMNTDKEDGYYYKRLYLSMQARIKSFKSGKAFTTRHLVGHFDRVMAVCYREGKLATGSDDRTVRIWSCEDGQCLRVLETHTVSDVKFNDRLVVTASFDNTAACWDMKTGHQLQLYIGHVAAVYSVDFDEDLNLLVTGSADETVKIWSLSEATLLRTLSQGEEGWVTKVLLLKNTPDVNSYSIISAGGQSVNTRVLDLDHQSMNERNCWALSQCRSNLQLKDDRVYFVCSNSSKDCFLIQFSVKNTGVKKCTAISYSNDIHSLLGVGSKYSLFISDDGEGCSLDVVEADTLNVITSSPIGGFRKSKRGSTYTAGETSWLDGFNSNNDQGVIFATSLMDNSICLVKWSDRDTHR